MNKEEETVSDYFHELCKKTVDLDKADQLRKQFEVEYAEEISKGHLFEDGDVQWFFDDCVESLYICWLESQLIS